MNDNENSIVVTGSTRDVAGDTSASRPTITNGAQRGAEGWTRTTPRGRLGRILDDDIDVLIPLYDPTTTSRFQPHDMSTLLPQHRTATSSVSAQLRNQGQTTARASGTPSIEELDVAVDELLKKYRSDRPSRTISLEDVGSLNGEYSGRAEPRHSLSPTVSMHDLMSVAGIPRSTLSPTTVTAGGSGHVEQLDRHNVHSAARQGHGYALAAGVTNTMAISSAAGDAESPHNQHGNVGETASSVNESGAGRRFNRVQPSNHDFTPRAGRGSYPSSRTLEVVAEVHRPDSRISATNNNQHNTLLSSQVNYVSRNVAGTQTQPIRPQGPNWRDGSSNASDKENQQPGADHDYVQPPTTYAGTVGARPIETTTAVRSSVQENEGVMGEQPMVGDTIDGRSSTFDLRTERPGRQRRPSRNINQVLVERSGSKRCYRQLSTGEQLDDVQADSAGVRRLTRGGNLKSNVNDTGTIQDSEATQRCERSGRREDGKRPNNYSDHRGSSDDYNSDQSDYSPRDERRHCGIRGKKGDSSSTDDDASRWSKRSSRKHVGNRRKSDSSDSSDQDDRDRMRGRSNRRDNRDGRHHNRPSSPDDSPSPRRRRSRTRYHKHWIKPEKFNGETSFENFMVTFNNAAKFNGWDKKEKLAYLRASLAGVAVQLLWGADNITYDKLVERLKDRFGAIGMEERYQTELRCRRRRDGEPIRELAQDIRRLMSLAYPGQEDCNLGQHIARDSFLTALGDPDLQIKIRERDPHTLEEAVKLALRIEITRAAVDSASTTRHRVARRVEEQHRDAQETEEKLATLQRQDQTEGSSLQQSRETRRDNRQQNGDRLDYCPPRRRERRSRATSQTDNVQLEQLTKKLQDMEAANRKKDAEMSARLDMMNRELERYQHLDQIRTHNALRPNLNQRQEHQPAFHQSARFRQGEGSRSILTCWNCNQPGHLARECPVNRHSGPPPPPVRSTQPCPPGQRGDQHQREYRTSGISRSTVRTTNRDAIQPATYLRARVDGRERDCLLDSGSEVSILPSSLVHNDQIEPTSYTLKAANGSEIIVLGQATVPLVTPWYSTTVTGLVTDHVDEVMLGVDWLTDNDADWSFKDSSICLGDHRHRLSARPKDQKWCRRVITQEDTVVPPRSQQNLQCKVMFHGRPSRIEGQQWETEPTALPCGLLVARTLTPSDQYVDVQVRVMNLDREPKKVTAGTVVSDLEPVTVLDPSSLIFENAQRVRTVHSRQLGEEEVPEYIRKLLENVDPATPEGVVVELQELLLQYRQTFSESERDLGLTDITVHQIDTGSARPVRQQLRKFAPAHVEAISQHVDNMLEQGIIESTSSPWASNVVLVRKKDGTYRCCIDYRQLNSVTVRDAYPLPRIDSCLDAMSGAGWFSAVDLRSSYHQVYLAPEDSAKTAFICPRGMYKFRTMPFGLCNAGATFQRLMDIVMSGLHLDICLVYLDDIVVFARTPEEHLERLRIVFDRLRKAGLKMKPEKCSFFQRSVSFLGHIVSDKGIETDPAKIQAVTEWPVPASVTEVRSFIGLASYYRRFVRDFAKIAAPLHALSQKDKKFSWSREAQESFDALKLALTSPPILAMPNDGGFFTLDTDASNETIGAVLSQQQDGAERVIAYASRSLDKRERNYCVTRKELLAVVHFLRYFKQYLLGRQFRVRTDHAALMWLKKTPDPIGQQARWLEQMEEFDFTIEHRPGIRHANADALSRRPCPKKDCCCKEPRSALQSGPADRPPIGLRDDGNRSSEPYVITASEEETELKTRQPPRRDTAGYTMMVRRYKNGSRLTPRLQPIPEEDETSVEEQKRIHFQRAVQADTPADSSVNPEDQTALPWSLGDLEAAQKDDADVSFIYHLVESGVSKPTWKEIAHQSKDVKVLWSFWPRLAIRNGLLQRRFESEDQRTEHWQVVMPRSHRKDFVTLIHAGPTGGHFGLKKTAAAVQARAYWPTWSSDLAACLKKCPECAQYHRGALPRQAEMQTPLAGEPWERISIDITGPHPKSSRQNVFILTLVDHFSKWAEAIAIRNHTASTVANVLMTHVFSRFGMPLEILTDRGTEFESELFNQLLRWLEIDKLRTTAYKPSTNGVVERFHRTLNAVLGKVTSENQRDWDERLPYAMAAYRASVHTSTGFTPNRLFLGRENRMPVDLVMGLPPKETNGNHLVDDFVARQQEIADETYQLVRRYLGQNAQRRKSIYDARVRKNKYSIGDWVWYYYPRKYTQKSPKWQRNFTGPYRVTRIIPPVNYVLQKSPRAKPFVVHADKLKRCYSTPPANWTLAAEADGDAAPVVALPPSVPQPVAQSTKRRKSWRRSGEERLESDVERELYGPRARRRPAYLDGYDCRSINVDKGSLQMKTASTAKNPLW